MLIRTQFQEALIDCSSFEIRKDILGACNINCIFPKTGKTYCLGRYAKRSRCQEITGEIERLIIEKNKGVYEMPRE